MTAGPHPGARGRHHRGPDGPVGGSPEPTTEPFAAQPLPVPGRGTPTATLDDAGRAASAPVERGRQPAATGGHRPAAHRRPEPVPAGGRVAGVDAARALALAGMASVHILPVLRPGGGETVAGAISAGRASALFAVLAGVGIALATGGSRPPATGRAHAAAAAGLLVRGALVAAVGFALVTLFAKTANVAVILPYYGLLFAVATPLLRLRAPSLAALAAVWCVLGPVASHLLRTGARPGEQPGFAALAAPARVLRELALTGYYPVVTWTAFLLAGMAVGRTGLRSGRVAAGLLGGGAALAVAAWAGSAWLLGPGGGASVLGPELARRRYGTVPTDTWWWLAVEAPHTGTPFDLAHTAGTALAVLGAMLLLARAAPALVWPLTAVGSLTLTLYTLHVAALGVFTTKEAAAAGVSLGTLLVLHLAAALVIGVLVRLAGWRGPLEAVVAAASRAVGNAVRGGARPG